MFNEIELLNKKICLNKFAIKWNAASSMSLEKNFQKNLNLLEKRSVRTMEPFSAFNLRS